MDNAWFGYGFLLVAAYLIGSIPFGLLIGKLAGLGDIRRTGSGNIGATNMMRAGGKKLAIITLILDMLKGAVPVAIAAFIRGMHEIYPHASTLPVTAYELMPLITGLFAVIGHCFPIWLKFRGGKGVATTLGIYLPFIYPFLVLAGTWLVVFGLTRTSSLAALVMVGLMPVFAWVGHGWEQAIVAACIAAIVITKHRSNIERMLRGEELAFARKPTEETAHADAPAP